MIRDHPKFPQSSMEQYKLMSKLPEYQVHNKQQDIQIKDHNYYHDNFNIWNNPFQANKKNYECFHAHNVVAQPEIERRKQQEIEDRFHMEARRRDVTSQKRKNERHSLQLESSQAMHSSTMVDVSDQKEYFTRHINNISNVAINGRADYLWNKMNKLSKKQLELSVNQRIIKMDEAAVTSIQNKLQKDLEVDEIKLQLQMENVKQIRQNFRDKHEQNFEKERKLGLVPQLKPLVQINANILRNTQSQQSKISRSQHNQTNSNYLNIQFQNIPIDKIPIINNQFSFQNQSHEFNNQPPQSFRLDSQYSQKYVDINRFKNAQESQANNRTDQLAQPKKYTKSYLIDKNPLDRTEFKGLLVSEVDNVTQNLKTHFNKTMLENSVVLKDRIQTTTVTRPSTKASFQLQQYQPVARKDQESNESSKAILNDLDKFERMYKGKRVGFPNEYLTQMQINQKSLA